MSVSGICAHGSGGVEETADPFVHSTWRNCMSFAEFTDPDGNLWLLRGVRRERDAEDIGDG